MKAILMIVCLGIGTYLFVFNKKINSHIWYCELKIHWDTLHVQRDLYRHTGNSFCKMNHFTWPED